MLVLPVPVGPVTSTIPCGRLIAGHVLHEHVDRVALLLGVVLLDPILDVSDRREQRHDGQLGGEADVRQRLELQGIRHGEVELLLEHGHGQNLVLLREPLGDLLERDCGNSHRGEVDERNP